MDLGLGIDLPEVKESGDPHISFQLTDMFSQPSLLILNTETAILPPRQHGTDKQVPKQMSVSSTKYSQTLSVLHAAYITCATLHAIQKWLLRPFLTSMAAFLMPSLKSGFDFQLKGISNVDQ